jgi:hypothetical protein
MSESKKCHQCGQSIDHFHPFARLKNKAKQSKTRDKRIQFIVARGRSRKESDSAAPSRPASSATSPLHAWIQTRYPKRPIRVIAAQLHAPRNL